MISQTRLDKTSAAVTAHFKADPNLRAYAKYVPSGLVLVFTYLDILDDIDKKFKAFPGIERTLNIASTNKVTDGQLKVVDWVFNTALAGAMRTIKEEEKRGKVKASNNTRHSRNRNV